MWWLGASAKAAPSRCATSDAPLWQPAPRGAFAVHDFIYEWAAERAVVYYTGRHATIHLAGELWNRPCPTVPAVDAVIGFDELLRETRQ